MPTKPETTVCRLCHETAPFVFTKKLLDKYEVRYYRCSSCESLQSEEPYWLGESYAPHTLVPDLSTLRRVLTIQRLVFWIHKIVGFSPSDKLLDWGGGNGMLVRLLRDNGVDGYVLDEYVKNLYAIGFDHQDGTHYQMITSIQVWEHFSNPDAEMDLIFGMQPQYILIATGLYNKQGADWAYLNAYGRHVFCYSNKGRDYIAKKYGYHKFGAGDVTFFSKKPLSPLQTFMMRAIFSSKFQTILDAAYVVWPKSKSLILRDRDDARHLIYEKGDVGKANWP